MILDYTKIYVAACKPERIRRLPEQLEKLNLPYTLERELPNPKCQAKSTWQDNASRRFGQQIIKEINKPWLWLEDDIDIPDNFLEIWKQYESTLPEDWQVAIIGWGLLCDDGLKIRKVAPGWWDCRDPFMGAQAILVNAGQWRERLTSKIYRCDVELTKVLRNNGISNIYFTDKILIGTNDPLTTFGDAVVQYPVMSAPRYFSWEKGYREVCESDFIAVAPPVVGRYNPVGAASADARHYGGCGK